MKKYLYIATWWPYEVDPSNSILSFSHAFITAENEDDAYRKGHQLVMNTDIQVGIESSLDNDYVVELPHRLEV